MERRFLLKHQGLLAIILIFAVLAIDQFIKLWVKTHMMLGESITVTPWFYIRFIENNGMAYGMTFFNKYALSVFRIIAAGAIGWYLCRLIIMSFHRTRYVLFVALVLAGAIGNIIDSMFYGLLFSASSFDYVSYLVPFGHGYASFLTGKVVDMFYFPLIVTTWPTWIPLVGGEEFIFFSPTFNFADAAITTGVLGLLLFCRHDLSIGSHRTGHIEKV